MYRMCLRQPKLRQRPPEVVFKKCGNCSFGTFSTLHFLRHLCVIKKAGFQCEDCFQVVSSRHSLRSHIYSKHTATEAKPQFNCQYCPFTCISNSQLVQHKRRQHRAEEGKSRKWLQCEHCDYQSFSKTAVTRHASLMHTQPTWFQCTDCEFRSRSRSYLGNHTRLQHGHVEKHECGICKMWFTKRGLTLHVTSRHTSDLAPTQSEPGRKIFETRPDPGRVRTAHKCQYCGYTTSIASRFNEHLINRHLHGVETIQCRFCDYNALSPSTIQAHILLRHAKNGHQS